MVTAGGALKKIVFSEHYLFSVSYRYPVVAMVTTGGTLKKIVFSKHYLFQCIPPVCNGGYDNGRWYAQKDSVFRTLSFQCILLVSSGGHGNDRWYIQKDSAFRTLSFAVYLTSMQWWLW